MFRSITWRAQFGQSLGSPSSVTGAQPKRKFERRSTVLHADISVLHSEHHVQVGNSRKLRALYDREGALGSPEASA